MHVHIPILREHAVRPYWVCATCRRFLGDEKPAGGPLTPPPAQVAPRNDPHATIGQLELPFDPEMQKCPPDDS